MDNNKATEPTPEIISATKADADHKELNKKEEKICCNKCQDCKKKDIPFKHLPNV
jgi:hypothetical protein